MLLHINIIIILLHNNIIIYYSVYRQFYRSCFATFERIFSFYRKTVLKSLPFFFFFYFTDHSGHSQLLPEFSNNLDCTHLQFPFHLLILLRRFLLSSIKRWHGFLLLIVFYSTLRTSYASDPFQSFWFLKIIVSRLHRTIRSNTRCFCCARIHQCWGPV